MDSSWCLCDVRYHDPQRHKLYRESHRGKGDYSDSNSPVVYTVKMTSNPPPRSPYIKCLRFGSFEIFKTRDPLTGRSRPSVGRKDIPVYCIYYSASRPPKNHMTSAHTYASKAWQASLGLLTQWKEVTALPRLVPLRTMSIAT